uniref:Uncharacterized protein n=1 Tax=Rhizophora mucronata TaxID=61149 RepID=A0A2P2P7C2_RHIMU
MTSTGKICTLQPLLTSANAPDHNNQREVGG